MLGAMSLVPGAWPRPGEIRESVANFRPFWASTRQFPKVTNVSRFGPMTHFVRQEIFGTSSFSIRILFLEVRHEPGDASKSIGPRKNSSVQNECVGFEPCSIHQPKSTKKRRPIHDTFSLARSITLRVGMLYSLASCSASHMTMP